jgi:hypothetical protein
MEGISLERSREGQGPKHFRNVEGRTPRRLPNGKAVSGPMSPAKIDTQGIPCGRGAGIQAGIRDAHKAEPDFFIIINSRGYFAARTPNPTLLMVRLVEIHIDIDPLALWRNLNLLISADVVRVGAEKYLRDIPVPELVGLVTQVGIGLEIERIIVTVGTAK